MAGGRGGGRGDCGRHGQWGNRRRRMRLQMASAVQTSATRRTPPGAATRPAPTIRPSVQRPHRLRAALPRRTCSQRPRAAPAWARASPHPRASYRRSSSGSGCSGPPPLPRQPPAPPHDVGVVPALGAVHLQRSDGPVLKEGPCLVVPGRVGQVGVAVQRGVGNDRVTLGGGWGWGGGREGGQGGVPAGRKGGARRGGGGLVSAGAGGGAV